MRSENERRPVVVASLQRAYPRDVYYIQYIIHIYSIYIYLYVQLILHHIPNVRNKTSYETPSFHTSGTARNVPYTILTHSHIFKATSAPPRVGTTGNYWVNLNNIY